MSRYRLILILIFTLCLSFSMKAQQETQFSTHMGFSVLDNPACISLDNKYYVEGKIKNQWSGISESPEIYLFDFEAPLNFLGKKHGIGITFISNKMGTQINNKYTRVGVSYAYKTIFSGWKMNLGLRFDYISSELNGSFDFTNLNWNDPKDIFNTGKDNLTPINSSNGCVDVSCGVYFKKKDLEFGFTISNILNTKLTSIRTISDNKKENIKFNRKYKAIFRYNLKLQENLEFIPFMLTMTDFDYTSVNIGGITKIQKHLFLGIGYRYDDSIFASIGYEFKNGIKVGYAYDYGISSLSRDSNGSHELMLAYSFKIKTKRSKYSSVRFI